MKLVKRTFRLSARQGLLGIAADAIAVTSKQDGLSRKVPSALAGKDYVKAARLRPGEKSVYAAILGSIPSEESDDEFCAAVDALS